MSNFWLLSYSQSYKKNGLSTISWTKWLLTIERTVMLPFGQRYHALAILANGIETRFTTKLTTATLTLLCKHKWKQKRSLTADEALVDVHFATSVCRMFQRREQASRLHSTEDEKDRLRRERCIYVLLTSSWAVCMVAVSGSDLYCQLNTAAEISTTRLYAYSKFIF